MIKTFEQFVNENYNEIPSLAFGEVYGYPLFNEISESLMTEIYNNINEGKLTIDTNILEEGLFDNIGKLFKKGSDAAGEKLDDIADEIDSLKGMVNYKVDIIRKDDAASDAVSYAKELKNAVDNEKVFAKIEELCNAGKELCEKLAEKEEDMYKTISEKMTATNDAIKKFTQDAIDKIKEIINLAKDKISAVIGAVVLFCKEMANMALDALKKFAMGTCIAFALPFVLAYSVYEGAKNVCSLLIEKSKEAAKAVKEAFINIKNAIADWVNNMLEKAKDKLKEAYNNVKDGAKSAYNKIGKAYLYVVTVFGQMVSDAKDSIKEAYDSFIESAKEFGDEVKAYISDKWDIISKWCKNTATSFAEGVKNVWEKMKEKVNGAVESVKDTYKTLKDEADNTWNDFLEWNDTRKQNSIKAKMKYAIDEWGKDVVSSWIDEL